MYFYWPIFKLYIRSIQYPALGHIPVSTEKASILLQVHVPSPGQSERSMNFLCFLRLKVILTPIELTKSKPERGREGGDRGWGRGS